jgi:nucleoid-associated protein YgaU
MVKNKMHFFLLIVMPIAIIISSCRVNVPIREMTDAKKGIAQAQEVKADKYAGEELEAAKKKLFDSQGRLADKNVDGAKKSAEESANLSLAAYNKSLPLLARDTISIAEKSYAEAGEINADRLAPDEYREAEEKLKEANDQFQNKKYYESYEAALKADEKAKNARNAAIGKKDVLRDSIVEVKRTLEEAEKYGAKKYAPDKYKLANENVEIAEKSYDNLELKKGFSAVEVAKLNADDALLTALKNSAGDKFVAAEKTVQQAQNSPQAAQKKDEMNASKESLDNAKAALAESKYKESITASDEAIRLALSVMEKKAEGTELASSSREKQVITEPTEQTGQKQEIAEEKDYDIYKVVSRRRYTDCLWNIAQRYYRNPRLWKRIYEFNKDKIRDPNLIYPGWLLKIPRLKK